MKTPSISVNPDTKVLGLLRGFGSLPVTELDPVCRRVPVERFPFLVKGSPDYELVRVPTHPRGVPRGREGAYGPVSPKSVCTVRKSVF